MKIYVYQKKVRSESSDKEYTVSLDKNNQWSCSCPHYIYRRLECKHIKKEKEFFRVPAVPREYKPKPNNRIVLDMSFLF